MQHIIETKVGTFTIDTAKVSQHNLEVGFRNKAVHMLKNEVDSAMLSWDKKNPKATKVERNAEQYAACERMLHRMYNTDLDVKASPVRLSPVESELRDLMRAEANRRSVANGGGQLRGAPLTAAVDWLMANDSDTVAKLRKVAEQKAGGVDKIIRKATAADIANLMALPKGKAA